MKKNNLILLIVFLHFVLLSGCASAEASHKSPPLAVNGVLDLSEWDFSGEGTVAMDREREMYWNRLLTPEDFDHGHPMPTGLISVPGLWEDTEVNGTKLSGDGYATMRLKVITDRPDLLYASRLKNVFISYKLWVNDRPAVTM
ncbi:hypothetical protein [Ferviditalea candida]|uniref:Uncharacterized protein n=1 Tax=Ferviditalea candida TaxID=3108399 RepID=A0ABU5ZIA4_9BACL|nr:hypothetical protein [Paenibacillaceae bacterium T2]